MLAWPGGRWGSAPGGPGATFYGVLVLLGGLVPVFTGMLGKIVPFLTWMRAYGPKVGRQPVPSAGALTHPRLESWGLALQGLAVLPLAAGAWQLDVRLLTTGAGLLAAAAGLLLANFAGVLRHLWSPGHFGPQTAPRNLTAPPPRSRTPGTSSMSVSSP